MGGHCSSCIDVIESSGKFKIVGLVAKNKKVKNKNKKYKIIGTDKDLNNIFKRYKYAHIAIGQIKNLNLRKKIFNKLKKIGFVLPVIISKKPMFQKKLIWVKVRSLCMIVLLIETQKLDQIQ